MFPLLESIRIYKRKFHNLRYHEERIHRSRLALMDLDSGLDLERVLSVPEWVGEGVYKCRVVYDRSVRSIEFTEYSPRKIKSLRLVYDDNIEYPFKFLNRERLTELYSRRENCDEILIVKRGSITDTTFSNVVFYDGGAWFTPSRPLLEGTKRRQLLDDGLILERDIRLEEIGDFRKVSLINAMLDLCDVTVEIGDIS